MKWGSFGTAEITLWLAQVSVLIQKFSRYASKGIHFVPILWGVIKKFLEVAQKEWAASLNFGQYDHWSFSTSYCKNGFVTEFTFFAAGDRCQRPVHSVPDWFNKKWDAERRWFLSTFELNLKKFNFGSVWNFLFQKNLGAILHCLYFSKIFCAL